jgi:hypothetical protein
LRGNVVAVVRGGAREVSLREAMPSKEITRMMNKGELRGGGEEDEGERLRGSFSEGVSMEAEYGFSRAVEEFCRISVQEGRYRGSYRFNLRNQMARRVRKKVEGLTKVKVLTVGASEVGRMRKEWEQGGAVKLDLLEEVRIRGKLDRKEGVRVEGLLDGVEGTPDKILIGGAG